MTMPVRPAGRIICNVVRPGATQKLTQPQKEAKKDVAYPTPNSSDSSDSASCSAVSIAIESPTVQQHPPDVPKLVVLTPTPNLTPHPTPPATPLLAASAPPAAPRSLAPLTPPTPSPPESARRAEPPGPLFLPRSATRGMGSPVFPPLDPAAPHISYAPQSTHILPLGGRDLSVPVQPMPKTNTGSKFYLAAHAGTSGSSHSSSRSSGTSNSYENGQRSQSSSSGSDSSRERDQAQGTFVHGPERGLGNARGRGRGQARNGGRQSSSSEEVQVPPQSQQQKSPSEAKKLSIEQPPPALPPPRSISAPYLGGIGLGLEGATGKRPTTRSSRCYPCARRRCPLGEFPCDILIACTYACQREAARALRITESTFTVPLAQGRDACDEGCAAVRRVWGDFESAFEHRRWGATGGAHDEQADYRSDDERRGG
ncbi:hypothetical protein B0H12DRAFT_179684 [Mycena haematopus]|nr:hypothetical protein B0H12DRAFT_179684 [Mycena haematopus]